MTVTIVLNSSAPFCWEPAAAAPVAVAAGVGVVTRLVPVVERPPLAVEAARVWPVMSCVSSEAVSVALAWRRKTTSVFVLGSEVASRDSINLSKNGC